MQPLVKPGRPLSTLVVIAPKADGSLTSRPTSGSPFGCS